MIRFPFAVSMVVLSAVTLLTGCGAESNNTVTVQGKVTVDGKPVEQGSITFLATDGETPSSGGVIAGGEYSAEIVPGEKTIMILGNEVVGQELVLEGVPDSGMRDKLKTTTHPNYNAAHLTPLKASITEATESLDFALTKDGKGS